MATKRLARLNEQLKREISELVHKKVRDPRVGLVTITSVEVSGDITCWPSSGGSISSSRIRPGTKPIPCSRITFPLR